MHQQNIGTTITITITIQLQLLLYNVPIYACVKKTPTCNNDLHHYVILVTLFLQDSIVLQLLSHTFKCLIYSIVYFRRHPTKWDSTAFSLFFCTHIVFTSFQVYIRKWSMSNQHSLCGYVTSLAVSLGYRERLTINIQERILLPQFVISLVL